MKYWDRNTIIHVLFVSTISIMNDCEHKIVSNITKIQASHRGWRDKIHEIRLSQRIERMEEGII